MDKIKHALKHNPEIILQDIADILIDGDGLSPERLLKDVCSMIRRFLLRKDKRPFCPDCQAVMVKCHRNDVPGIDWLTYWACDCVTPQNVVTAANTACTRQGVDSPKLE